MDNDFIQENAKERERLFKLTAGLKDSDLARPVGKEWTVATKLLHLAFWDDIAWSCSSDGRQLRRPFRHWMWMP